MDMELIAEHFNEDDNTAEKLRTLIKSIEETATPTEVFSGTDAESLRRQSEHLRLELREKLNAGLGDEAVRTRRMISECDIRIKAQEIKSARESISEMTARIAEINSEMESARQIKGEANAVLNEKLEAVEEAGVRVERVNLILYSLEQEADSLRDSRKTFRNQLENLLQSAEEN